MNTKEYVEKKEKLFSLLMESDDELVRKFMDPESDKMLDEKIEVLTALQEGKTPAEIPNFYKVLDNYPSKEMWD